MVMTPSQSTEHLPDPEVVQENSPGDLFTIFCALSHTTIHDRKVYNETSYKARTSHREAYTTASKLGDG